MSAESVLRKAASAARQATSTNKAVDAAWAALHTDGTESMVRAFHAWAEAEDYHSSLNNLGGVVRKRYDTPAGVADSLLRAAFLALEPA